MKNRLLTSALFGLLATASSLAQSSLPVIRSVNKAISYRTGTETRGWNITPELKPDILEVPVIQKNVRVSFFTGIDSISFTVKVGSQYDFIILLNGKDSAYTRVTGIKEEPAAVFSKKYIAAHDKKTFIEMPEVYELVNIMFAITDTAKKDPNFVYKQSDYYNSVLAWFDTYRNGPGIKVLNDLLKQGQYFNLKMDAYAFVFDRKNKIVKSDVYNRVAWGNKNSLLPYIALLQEFADQSSFRKFYAGHRMHYQQQERYFRDTLDIASMQVWLNRNFPTTTYNSFKVIFSPLVARNQSANWFESNGFREAQAHVNFPYLRDRGGASTSPAATTVMAGNLLFTELNHAFINPEADKYPTRITEVMKDLGKWAESGKPAQHYNNAYMCFNEYMNWALVSLRIIDHIQPDQQDNLIASVGRLGTNRGFTKFAEFNLFLADLYRKRAPGTTVAALYPQIIEWFGKQ